MHCHIKFLPSLLCISRLVVCVDIVITHTCLLRRNVFRFILFYDSCYVTWFLPCSYWWHCIVLLGARDFSSYKSNCCLYWRNRAPQGKTHSKGGTKSGQFQFKLSTLYLKKWIIAQNKCFLFKSKLLFDMTSWFRWVNARIYCWLNGWRSLVKQMRKSKETTTVKRKKIREWETLIWTNRKKFKQQKRRGDLFCFDYFFEVFLFYLLLYLLYLFTSKIYCIFVFCQLSSWIETCDANIHRL